MSEEVKHSPLDQFKLYDIVPIAPVNPTVMSNGTVVEHVSLLGFTNSSLFMVIIIAVAVAFLAGGMKRKALIPGRWQSMTELLYEFTANMLKENVGAGGRAYFPFIFSLFIFILFSNLVGLLPYSFTITSHIIVTFAFALLIFVGVTVLGFVNHGTKYFSMFLPHGTPLWLAPVMVIIELFSYFARPITLSIRLAANMMAGHVVLKVVAGFIMSMGAWGILPFSFIVLMTGFELFIAILQAYIFTVLTCVYLNDAVNLH